LNEFYQKKRGGFLLEASSVLEGPLGFAEFIVDEYGFPLWGKRQKEVMKSYPHFAGIFINIHDGNDGRIFRDPQTKQEKILKPVTSEDKARFNQARALCRQGMFAAGAQEVFDTLYLSHHVQGTCRMGEDKSKSVVNSNCESHDVSGLFVSDGSLIPTVIDVNPSQTIMALSKRLGEYLLKHEFGS
jgi:choline dehydrogenase-like flavoprotein